MNTTLVHIINTFSWMLYKSCELNVSFLNKRFEAFIFKWWSLRNHRQHSKKNSSIRFILFWNIFPNVKSPAKWPRVSSYTIVDYGIYTSFGYHTFLLQQISKNFWLSKISTNLSCMKSFRQIGAKLWKIGAIQNRYPILVYGVMSDRESKNPRHLLKRSFK